jgi:hypothetical protein
MSKPSIRKNWTTTQAVPRAVSFVELTMTFPAMLQANGLSGCD